MNINLFKVTGKSSTNITVDHTKHKYACILPLYQNLKLFMVKSEVKKVEAIRNALAFFYFCYDAHDLLKQCIIVIDDLLITIFN